MRKYHEVIMVGEEILRSHHGRQLDTNTILRSHHGQRWNITKSSWPTTDAKKILRSHHGRLLTLKEYDEILVIYTRRPQSQMERSRRKVSSCKREFRVDPTSHIVFHLRPSRRCSFSHATDWLTILWKNDEEETQSYNIAAVARQRTAPLLHTHSHNQNTHTIQNAHFTPSIPSVTHGPTDQWTDKAYYWATSPRQ